KIPAAAVISSADPQHTYLTLIGPAELDPTFSMKVRAFKTAGAVAKVNLALSGLPAFNGITDAADLSAKIHIGPDTDYIERAFDAAKYGDFSSEPYMQIVMPSVTDPSLAPNGRHVMSIHVQYAPYRLKDDWDRR